jgi:aromatic ring-opening dioxygenase catalytic subunit (LigB family)
MAELLGAFATSHATTFINPALWEETRSKVRALYVGRYGSIPAEPMQVARETLSENQERYAHITQVHDLVRKNGRELKPDAIILIGNDQNENYGDFAAPQFAIHTGGGFFAKDFFSGTGKTYRGHPELAETLLRHCIEHEFDVVRTAAFSGQILQAHAHAQVLLELFPEADIPVVLIFVNAITPPLAPARRCFAFGAALRDAIEHSLPNMRLLVGVSGGLSHFTFGFPYASLKVKRDFGTICEEFDHGLLKTMRAGELSRIAELSDEDLLNNGDLEFRQAITLMGLLRENSRPQALVYEPFYRAMMGMWAGYWALA